LDNSSPKLELTKATLAAIATLGFYLTHAAVHASVSPQKTDKNALTRQTHFGSLLDHQIISSAHTKAFDPDQTGWQLCVSRHPGSASASS
jgi:hypothetical protein